MRGLFFIGRGHMDNQHSAVEMPLTKHAQPWTAGCPLPAHPLPTPFPQLHELAGYPHAHNHGDDGEIALYIICKKIRWPDYY